ncbi:MULTISPECIES: flagellar hook assembly protein FlgD [Paenibacillus]|uniref:hypothetical protein n=1 Tax=Paenibacillus TaxID=44249 RepID=UPI0022B8996B|nr:hypothetical protein [Paenibacillus caseinilyticus]MCZ8522510.1 hypothetical protein [Paenibacillus caseinilyticus]
MKNFSIGLLVGIGVTAATGVWASNSIQATLFPSILHFHVNGTTTTIDGTGENGILNYNNKAYVPLRLFSESIGATVDYRESSTTDAAKHQVDVIREDDQNFKVKDPGGFVSLGSVDMNLVPVLSENGDPYYSTVTGIIRINQDLSVSHKKIQLSIQTKENQYKSTQVDISNPENKPLKEGDIRIFTAYYQDLHLTKKESIAGASLNVITEDSGTWIERQDGIQPGSGSGIRQPFHIIASASNPPWVLARDPEGGTLKYKSGEPIGLSFRVQAALWGKPVFLREPWHVSVEVKDTKSNKVVWSGDMPALPASEYTTYKKTAQLEYFWDQRDLAGSPVPPGSYHVDFKSAAPLKYSDTAQGNLQTQQDPPRFYPFDFTIESK